MLTPGHVASSYLLTKSASLIGIDFSFSEVLAVVVAGNLPDVDFILGFFTGKKGELHHQNITHTPLGILILLAVVFILFNTPFALSLFLALSMFLHLILDDLAHLLSRMRLISGKVNPQINWLYPFTKYKKNKLTISNKETLKNYLTKAKVVFYFEAFLVVFSFVVFIVSG